MKAVINIGLNVGKTDVRIPEETVRSMLAVLQVRVKASRIDEPQDGSEATFIASVDQMTRDKADILADVLHQDCIAVWWKEREQGELIGPRAADWGTFDPAYFKLI